LDKHGQGALVVNLDASFRELIATTVRSVVREELQRCGLDAKAPADSTPADAPLTPAEAGRLASCTAETVRRAVRAGKLPASTRGRSILLEREDVLRWAGRLSPATVVDLREAARQAVARANGAR
jgi:excisionase family DNA binding protein